MAIPELDDDGFLPEGVHECSLHELQQRFGDVQSSDQRSVLFDKLGQYLQEVRSTGLVVGLIVDGSFVTNKVEPNDIDLVLILPADHDFAADLRPFEYNVLSRRRVHKRYAFDVLVARENSPELVEYVEFFQQIRGETDRRKGILKVVS